MTAPLFGIAVLEGRRDTLGCTPVARQLAMSHPDATIVWFTTADAAPVLENNPWIHEVVVVEAPESDPYQEVTTLEASRPWKRFLTPSIRRNIDRFPESAEWDVVVLGSDIPWIVPFMFVLELSDAEVALARRYWDRLPGSGPRILVEVEGDVPCKDWSFEWLVDLVDAFADLEPTLVLTADQPPPFFYEVQKRWPNTVWCREPFRQNAEFINLCDVFVGIGGAVSVASYSTHCRRNVPHIEVAVDERRGVTSLRHPEDVWQCYGRGRFREAVTAVASRLRGGEFTPSFAPRHLPSAGVRSCPGCGAAGEPGGDHGFATCVDCQLLFAEAGDGAPSSPDSELSPAARAQRIAARREHLRCALETWRGPIEGALIVEVGCKGGELLRDARARGMRTLGLTDDAETLALPDAAELGIRSGTLASAGLAEGAASIVMLSHELQRGGQPNEAVELVQHLLEPGGIAYFTVPNVGSMGHRALHTEWPWLGRGRNSCHLSMVYFRRALAPLGLFVEVMETTPGEYDPDALVALFRRLKPDVREEMLAALVGRCCAAGAGEELRVVARKRGVSKSRAADEVDWGAADRAAAARQAAIGVVAPPVAVSG